MITGRKRDQNTGPVKGDVMNSIKTVTGEKNPIGTLALIYMAIGVSLIAVCSWISIPTTVPFTLQTFAVFVVLMTLGGKRGTLTTIVYVMMGAIGIPVFAGFTGGIGIILGTTGGYILGFIFMGPVYIAITKLFGNGSIPTIAAMLAGLFVCYAFGTAWFMFIYLRNTGAVSLMTVLSWCVFPFIIPDLVKMALAFVLSKRISFLVH